VIVVLLYAWGPRITPGELTNVIWDGDFVHVLLALDGL
jgi:hypothetical protein